jgi:hypothetical protein
MENKETNPIVPKSLQALARLGMQAAKADGFALDRLGLNGDSWQREISEGVAVPYTRIDNLSVVRYALNSEQIAALSFVFTGQAISREAKSTLAQIAGAAEAVWRVWTVRTAYLRHAFQVARLEAELVDAKVADRANALLDKGDLHGNPIEVICRSIQNIVRPYQLGPVLESLVAEMEQEVSDYALIRQAKEMLEERQSLTEAQAYSRLRQLSRQTRRRLPDIASELIELGFVRPGYRAKA